MALLALTAGGCAPGGQPIASLASGPGATVAFESIDGPPPAVFQKLVENLAAEAVARQVAVISREAAPHYRIRGYLAAHMVGKRTHIGWVWDVYDGEKRRTLRITGEEPSGRSVADAWSAADDQMLHRIARTSMDRLAAFLGAAGSPSFAPARPPTAEEGTPVAAAGDGVSGAAPTRRPQRVDTALAAALALADAGR